MKLDRNINKDGTGKYALVNIRKLAPVIASLESGGLASADLLAFEEVVNAFDLLVDKGFITLGNESEGDQFFVMKYKDKFTASGLRAYANAVAIQAHAIQGDPGTDGLVAELREYAAQMRDEADAAQKLGNRIPD